MSKKGTILHSAERNLLLKLMNFFEEEKKKRLTITPYSVEDIIVMKNIAKSTNSSQADTSEPTDIELKLLENEKKYQNYLKSYDNIVKCTAAATGVSERTLRRIKVEAKKKMADQATPSTSGCSNIKLSTPKKTKPPKKRLDIDDFMVCSIRNIIEQYYTTKKEVPTLRKVLAQAKKDFNFPGEKNTLWKIIKTKLGYSFKKCKTVRQFLIQKPEIAAWRARYLRKMRENDEKGADKRPVVYLDETWIHSHYTVSKCWQNSTDASVKKNFNPGQRWIVVHAGGENGFVSGAGLVYKCKSSQGDYHNEMDANNFKKYLEEKLLPNLPENSILVLDNAPYHSRQINKIPTSAARKEIMQNWLQENGISYDPRLTKKELYYLICKSKPDKQYEIDELVKSYGHEILRLPPYQCDLNPIEYIWNLVKYRVAEKNVTQSEKEIEKLTQNAIESITAEDWKKEINHVDRLRQEYWERDRLQELIEGEMIISVGSDSESSEYTELNDSDSADISGVELMSGVDD